MNKSIKWFNMLVAVMLSAMCCGLTACGDDDDEDEPVVDKYTTEYQINVTLNEDVLKTADVKAYVFSPEGVVTEETITRAANTWTLKGDKVPDKAGVMLTFDVKKGVAEGVYSLGYKSSIAVTSYKNGEVDGYEGKSGSKNMSVKSENLEKFYGTQLTLAGAVAADGKATVTDGSNIDFGFNAAIGRPAFGGYGF